MFTRHIASSVGTFVRQTAAQTQARNIAVVACTMPMGVVRFRRMAVPKSKPSAATSALLGVAARQAPPAGSHPKP